MDSMGKMMKQGGIGEMRGNQKLGKGCCPETKLKPGNLETASTTAQVTRDDQIRVTPHLKGLIRAHMAARALGKRKKLSTKAY